VCDPGDDLCGPVPSDGGVDGGVVDSGPADTGAGDAGLVDSGAADTGAGDAGLADSGAADTGNDASRREAGADAGRDASKREAGMDAAEDAAGDADSNATGYAQGGGCKTATGTSPRAPLPWIGVAALVLARVRARRRERATKR
jgi:hypothetical protein